LVFLVVLSFVDFGQAKEIENFAATDKKIYETSEIVVAVTGGRIRSEPNLRSEVLKQSTIGTRFTVLEEKDGWYKLELAKAEKEGEEGTFGWISKSITSKYDDSKPGKIYQELVDKYFKRKSLSFNTAREIFEFLPEAADEAKTYETGGDLRLKHLLALSLTLKAIPINKQGEAPYSEFLEKYKNDVVYSEPAGEWYVRSEKFWQLHLRYQKHKIGEEIAWQAAGNPIPGECEGYINCYLYLLRVTDGEYLNFYPNGKYSRKSLVDVNNLLQPIVADLQTKSVYYTTSDITDRAEFNRILSELRKIISNTPHIEKQKILKQINLIAEGHR
jgi:hypothetical protein